MTHEEHLAYIDRHYEVDQESGQILGAKKTPYEEALARGEDWYEDDVDVFAFEDSLTLALPDGFLQEFEKGDGLGS